VGSAHSDSRVQVVTADETGLVIDIHTTYSSQRAVAHVRGETGVALPMVAELLAVPPGARVDIEPQILSTQIIGSVDLPMADESASVDPGVVAQMIPLGILRGVEAYALQVFPALYDTETRTLRLHDHLRLRIRFLGGAANRPAAAESAAAPLYRAFLNPPTAGWALPTPAARPVAGALANDWYDSSLPWVKIFVDTDGIYRITPARLRFFSIDPDDVDVTRLRLVLGGVDQPLHVTGDEDGHFGGDDEILFSGRYRRAPGPDGERDHESEYGARQTYWLTWGGDQISPRFTQVRGEPVADYPPVDWYIHRQHFELDQTFDQLEEAPDTLSDRWFWQNSRPLIARDPVSRGSQTFVGDISGFYEDGDPYDVRLRVAATGKTPSVVGDHHAFLTFNNQFLAEAIWAGQTSFVFDEIVPSTLLAERNRILFQALADLSRIDQIWFNWFELTFRRKFHAYPGLLSFGTDPAPEGHRITVEGFRHPVVTLLDVDGRRIISGLQVTAKGTLYDATFEDVSDGVPGYVIADRLSILLPVLEMDEPSDLRSHDGGAEAIIIHHADFHDAAQRLAAHRAKTNGVSVRTVSAQDIFDEYSEGRFAREPLAEFIEDIYWRWTPHPVYITLMGDATWDYRGIRTGRRNQTLVPSLYYNARGRGYSPSDHLLAMISGDDFLADVIIGRLPVDSAREADLVVDKIIAYDEEPAEGDWRSRVILAANWHPLNIFSAPSDSIFNRHMSRMGLRAQRFYALDNADLPNPTGKGFLDALNEGALIANFAGHGAVATMQYLFSAQFPDWDYMSQVANGRRLPLVTALSCLNGLFSEPTTEALSEQFVELPHGGAIAFISATAESRTLQHNLLSDFLFSALLSDTPLGFGGALTWAKARLLTVHPGWIEVPLTMQLVGDPMQTLALERAPDYVAQGIDLDSEPALRGQLVPLVVTVNSRARLGADSVLVEILAESSVGVDTLMYERRGPFSGVDHLHIQWRPASGGPHRLSVVIDPDDSTIESDEANNRFEQFIEVLVPREMSLLWPPAEAASTDLRLQALTPLDTRAVDDETGDVVEFALSTTEDFTDTQTHTVIAPVEQISIAQATAVAPAGASMGDVLFWRARLIDGTQLGPWSEHRSLRWTAEGVDSVRWLQRGPRLLGEGGIGVRLRNGEVVATARVPAFRPSSSTRQIGFTVLSLPGAGVLATDGTYLYAKRWFNDPSTIYPGGDVFSRIGTGFNGSIRGGDYGTLTDTTTAGISATYHDGFLYSEAGQSFLIERIDPVSGHLDTVNVPDGLLDWMTGRVVRSEEFAGQRLHALITSDGQQLYNVSMSSHLGMRVGWGVRVFEINAEGDWRLQREFVIPPTETGFTFRWTDGIVADGEHLYLIEFGGGRRIRMVSAEDGTFLDEWRSDQDTTRIISGQFDVANDLVWLGDLLGSGLFGYGRNGAVMAGELLSEATGPAASWKMLSVEGDGARVQLQGQRIDGDWTDLVAGVAPLQIDLANIDAATHRFLRLRAAVGPDTLQTLSNWALDFAPSADLELGAASADILEDQLHLQAWVRNRGLTAAASARLTLEQDGRSLAEVAIEPLARGETRRVRFDPLSLPEPGESLFLRLRPSSADGRGSNDVLELVLTLPGLTTITFVAEETGQRLQDGDAIGAGTVVRVLAPPLASGHLQLRIDDEIVVADTSWTTQEGASVLAHQLAAGKHHLRAALVRDGMELGVGEVTLRADERLRLANVLVAPHPLRAAGAFTWVLSHAAGVHIDIYSLSGRRIQRLGPQNSDAGFGKLAWDGTDAEGGRLASGTYVYVLTAKTLGAAEVMRQHRGAVVLLP
jgi:hypothetical protein